MALWVLAASALMLAAHGALAIGLLRQWRRDRRRDVARELDLRASVVVVVKDEERELCRLLESLAAQTRAEVELVFVDDGSTDRTGELLRRFAARRGRQVTVIRGQAELDGISPKQRRLDEGVAASSGDIVLFTDGDCTVPPRWVEDTCGHFADDEVGLVFGSLSVRRERGWLAALQAFDLPLYQHVAAGSAGLGMATGGCGNNQAVRRRALEQVGGFAGLGYTLTEDTALVSAVRRQGYAVRASTGGSTQTETAPVRTLAGLYQQRLRWMGGLWHAGDWATRLAVRGYGMACVAALLTSVLGAWWPVLWLWPAALWAGVLGIATVGAMVQQRGLLRWLPQALVLAGGFVLMQALLTTLMSPWTPSPVWKGRRLALDRGRPGQAEADGDDDGSGRTQGGAVVDGLKAGTLALLLGLVAVLPSRWVLAERALEAGAERWSVLAGGLTRDVSVFAGPVAMVAAVCALPRKRCRLLAQVVMSVVGLGLWCFMVTATESSLSRGVFPSWVDVGSRWLSTDLVRGSAEMFLLPRNTVPGLLVVMATIALLRWWPSATPGRWAAKVAGALLPAALVLALSSIGLRSARDAGSDSPLELFTVAALPEARACLFGACEPSALLDQQLPLAASSGRGAAILGWPAAATTGPHPFARAMPSTEVAQRAPWPGRQLVGRLVELSGELFGGSEQPIHIWQIALEGARGDDLHGINPAAPPEAAPFLAELYQGAADGAVGVLASSRTWTAGVRTPHGIAALTCGLGTLPYRLAVPRDLPDARLRCLPDLLADAGLAVGYAYGGSLAFEGTGAFMAQHALQPWVEELTLPAGAPRGAWGVADRAVFAAAAAAVPADRSSYGMVLSLSHHHPFSRPEDTPAGVSDRAEQAFALASDRAEPTDRRRLLTLAYTDRALRELFEELASRGLGERSIVVVSADHSIPDRALWRHRSGALPANQIRGLIPFVLWMSPQWFEDAPDPERARRLAASIQRELDRTALSQNDIPTVLLALLDRSPPIRALPADRRWHTMGGQATSPWHRAPGPPNTRIHGIHAATALYFVDADGAPTAPDEPAPLVVTPGRARSVTPSLRPAVAALQQLPRRH